ncbi:MAG TPA: type I DNA topoisomerase [Vicinamibacterales bacterium]|nr:type I DNA topoisomerase [Vicinamibacterales bacterium]
MPKPLVIVESPAKARTLSRFLGNKYRVEASYGHIRDLPESAAEVPPEIKGKPWGRLGVDTEGDFTPYYVVPADKKKNVTALRAAMKDASELILATDPDREGESISWHLKELLKPKVKVRRIVFHEITEEAVKAALAEAHDVDENLVRAQESRRILDRLYGYTLSPVLWKKVQTGLSAGRVQSVAVRLIVEREEERVAFRAASYWDLEAKLRGGDAEFVATLAKVGGQRVASGKDFDSQGTLTSTAVKLLGEKDAGALRETLMRRLPWSVTSVEEKPFTRRPSPPFTTSTLQQEANRKLGFSSERTMQIAQRLFQGMDLGGGELEGLISYHRTDSTTLSQKALGEAEQAVKELYGPEFHNQRQYQTKVRNAQEAHEAIRPTHFHRTPQSLERILESDELRVYELIWKRAVASQMADAKMLRTTVEITGETNDGAPATFNASGNAIEFAGFLRAYVEGSDDPAAELGEQESVLPKLAVGEQVWPPDKLDEELILLALDAKGHETSPPARYTEASLVKRLEEEGIGRPSTYAPTVATIQRRGYITRQGKALVPSFTAFAVTRLLRKYFGDYVDIGFTAEMEEILDQISNGEKDWLEFLAEFYHGDKKKKHRGLEHLAEKKLDEIEYPIIELGEDAESGLPVRVRIGRYGPFLQLGSQNDGGPRASLPDDLAPADLTLDKAIGLLKAKAQGPKSLGADPKSAQKVYVMHGRFGAYVQLGETPEDRDAPKPRRASLGRDYSEETITLDVALKLLSLPRDLGVGDDGEPIQANLGRFGPYVKHGSEFRSLEESDDVYTISFERAKELLAQPKKSMRRARQAPKELKALGKHPDSGEAVRILDGRYGPYVTDGTTNASVPKGTQVEAVTLASALELLAARAGMGGAKSKGRRGKAKTAKATPKAPKAKKAARASA